MKKSTILGLSAAICCFSGYAGVSQLPQKVQVVTESASMRNDSGVSDGTILKLRELPRETVARTVVSSVNEDFSRFVAGTEDAPDANDLAVGEDQSIDNSFTAQPGWSGAGVYQAGGCAYIGMYLFEGTTEEVTGYINTPSMDLSGNNGVFKIRFRARVGGSVAEDLVRILGIDDAITELTGYVDQKITNEWKEYEVTLRGGTAKHFVQFYGVQYPIFIDDIVIGGEEGSVDGIRNVVARVSSTADGLAIENPAGGEVSVYGINGACLYRDNSGAERQDVCLAKGFYVVKVGSEAIKVVR